MASIYESQVQAYGRRWHGPWLVIVAIVTLVLAGHWLRRPKTDEADVLAEEVSGSRYRAAVEIDGLLWTADLDLALACALKHDRRVLVAFHGISNTNAKLNEVRVFSDQQVKSALRRYVLVMLHTDWIPDRFYQGKLDWEDQRKDGEANLKFEQQTFQTIQIPLYVVLQPRRNGNVTVVAEYAEARINDQAGFVHFLQNPRPAGQFK